MSQTLTIPKNSKLRAADMCVRHNETFYAHIANVLAYLGGVHKRDIFERDMAWLLSRHKYVENGGSRFSYNKLHYTRADLIDRVMSLEGRKFFTLLSAYNPIGSKYDSSLLTGNVAYQKAVLSRMVRDLGPDAIRNTDSTFAYCRSFLQPVFDYNAFRDGNVPTCESNGSGFKWENSNSNQSWCCAEFIKGLGVKYCVYCNADGVYSFNLKERRPLPYASALDHFLPRHIHPYFALNLYNLVPSCTRCNTALKGKRETDLWSYASPYSDDLYGSFKVRAYHGNKEIGKVASGNVADIQLKYVQQRCASSKRVKELMQGVFQWENVYNGIYSDEIQDIFHRIRLLTTTFKRWMNDKKFVGANSDRLLYGCSMRKSEVCSYRFAKVIQDFAERYGGVRLRD